MRAATLRAGGRGRGPGLELAVDAAAAGAGRWATDVHSAYFGDLPASCGGCAAEAPRAPGDAHVARRRNGLRLQYSLADGARLRCARPPRGRRPVPHQNQGAAGVARRRGSGDSPDLRSAWQGVLRALPSGPCSEPLCQWLGRSPVCSSGSASLCADWPPWRQAAACLDGWQAWTVHGFADTELMPRCAGAAGDTAARALADVLRATRLHTLLARCVARMRAQAAAAAAHERAPPAPAAAPAAAPLGKKGAKRPPPRSAAGDSEPLDAAGAAGPGARGGGAEPGPAWVVAGSGRVRVAQAGAMRAVMEVRPDAAAARDYAGAAAPPDCGGGGAAAAPPGPAPGAASNGLPGGAHAEGPGSGGARGRADAPGARAAPAEDELPDLRLTVGWAGGGGAGGDAGGVRCRMSAHAPVPPALLRAWEDMAGAPRPACPRPRSAGESLRFRSRMPRSRGWPAWLAAAHGAPLPCPAPRPRRLLVGFWPDRSAGLAAHPPSVPWFHQQS